MMRYKISRHGIFDNKFGRLIPNDNSNSHYQEYLKWIAQGNEPEPEYTLDERREMRIAQTMRHEKSVESGGILIQIGVKKTKIHVGSSQEHAEKYARHASSIRRGIELTEFTVISNERKPLKLNKDALHDAQKLCSHLHDKCEQRCAELIDEISKSDIPEDVDIESGWPKTPYSAN